MEANKNDTTLGAVGMAAFALILLIVAIITGSVAVGIFFGAAWGFAMFAIILALWGLFTLSRAAHIAHKAKEEEARLNKLREEAAKNFTVIGKD